MTKSNPNLTNQPKRVNRPKQGWHRADIKAGLEKLGTSLKRVGLEAGYCDRSAARALDLWWPGVEKLIANKLGVEPWEIWPERYNDYGQPVQHGNPNKVKITRRRQVGNVKVSGGN